MTLSTIASGIITNPFTELTLPTSSVSLEQYHNQTTELTVELKAIINFKNAFFWGFTESPLFWLHICEVNSTDRGKLEKTHGGTSISSTELLGQDQLMLGEKVAAHSVKIRLPKNKTYKLLVSGWCMKSAQDECRAELAYDATKPPLKLGYINDNGFDRLYATVEVTT